ncbi:MAG: sodium ion-translocating decarboxylase subunit beta [Clostridia bacterium]|nr:sodium ion-translocating decarboxylase subunit beta [Clostridia bacterium]
MLLISFVLMYLAIVKKFEPMLLLPIAFGMFLINIPGAEGVLWGKYDYNTTDVVLLENGSYLFTKTGEVLTAKIGENGLLEALLNAEGKIILTPVFGEANEILKFVADHSYDLVTPSSRGLLWYLYFGVDKVIYPPLIFLGIGAMTDFGPLIANPKSMLIGAGAQLGIFIAFILASVLGFSAAAAAAIAIIGGADGPTAIMVTSKLAPDLISAIAVAAYSYMALIPIIQKPLMRLLTTKKERAIRMKPLRQVSKLEKILFPVVVTLVVGLILPDSITLLGMLMLGNLMKESGVVDRLSSQAQNGLMNTITIFLGVSVGCKAKGSVFLSPETLAIIGIGLFAFILGTIGGLLVAKLMCLITKGKINPLIGSAGVSAVPMAARISEDVGREYDPQNHLLMHAMGPNVAGVIGSAIAAGFLLACFA